ncbi:MAG TPA: M23 family metallopeptidase [Candidatus Polarisedimenticolaceae bacterium]|nr:M23 family metallopeptidase [Candidatus Polarisedimenticolaceae bacterium]
MRLLAALPLATLGACALAADSVVLSLDVHARQLAPGEPLRMEVIAPEPLAALEGEFLGRPVFLSRAAGEPERWVGWTSIGLDDAARTVRLTVHGSTASGREARGERTLSVTPKKFPREKLAVAPRFVQPPKEVEERIARERERLDAIYASRRALAPDERPFVRPVPGDPTSIFGSRRVYNGKPRAPHPGLDLRAATGTPVLASGPGVVALAEDLYYSGNTIIVDHGGGLFTVYAHLSELLVHAGDTAAAGQLIARSGATGRVTGPHLHWGAKIGQEPFDPTALLDPALFR